MTWYRAQQTGGGGGGIAKRCNYIKFNGSGFVLPNFKVNADYCIECTFNDPTYHDNQCIWGNAGNLSAPHCSPWQNRFYMGNGNGQSTVNWSAGEHTVIHNDANHKIIFDGVEIANYNPLTENRVLTVGCRDTNVKNITYTGYIKSYKITSLSTGNTLCRLVPYDFGGVGVFFDEINKVVYPPEGALPIDTIPLMMMTPPRTSDNTEEESANE